MFDFHFLPATGSDLLNLSGVVGSIIYVGGFALVQGERVCGNGVAYAVSKIVAAGLVLISLAGAFNLGAFLIQIGFIVFGVWGLLRRSGDARNEPTQPLRDDRSANCGVGQPTGYVEFS